MKYAKINKTDIANGPGTRVSIFVSGCGHHCKGCFNSEAWDFNFGEEFTDETIEEIIDALEPNYIHGLTVLGGEPLHQYNRENVLKLLKRVKYEFGNTKSIWIYTGYTIEELVSDSCEGIPDIIPPFHDLRLRQILGHTDVLVDGRFVQELNVIDLPFRGSTNQRFINVAETMNNLKVVEFNPFI